MIALGGICQRKPNVIGSRDYLSYSALSTYRTCPLKYYFRYVAELPEENASASLIFGSGIHAAIQAHFERLLAGDNPLEVTDLLEHSEQAWNAETRQVDFSGAETRDALKTLAV
jgi:ATP-dependent helicase/DNAse subunit B